MSFRLKIVLGLLLIQFLLVVMLIWSSLNFLRISNEVELSNRALVIAPSLAALMRPAVATRDLEELRREIEAVLFRRGIVYVRVLSPEGEVLVEGGDPDVLARPFVEDFLFEDVTDEVFDVYSDIERDGAIVGRVEVGLFVGEIQEIMTAARREMASIALSGLGLSIVFSWLLGNYFAGQLTRLRDATRRIASGDIGYQLPVAGNDELAQTANAFNTMSRKLATLYAEKQSALTAARQKASELHESERRIHAVLDHAMDAIFTFDMRGFIESFNPAAERIFGYPSAEVIGERISALIPDPYLSEHEARIREFLRTGDPRAFGHASEIEGRRRDGMVFPMEIDVSQVQLEGRYLFIAVARDITQRRRAEADLRRAQAEAMASSRNKFEFIANVSDEIRAPVSDMLGALGLLGRTGLSPEQQARIDAIQSSGDALITIVNDMLDFARIEAGTLELESIDFDLWQTVDAVYQCYRDRAAAKGLELTYVIPCTVPAALRGDPARLRQLLVNLADNAVKFTDHGEVVIRVDAVEQAGGHAVLRFDVQDTGIGIPQHVQQRIFEIFSRPPSAAGAGPFGSSGLGLMISKRLAEMMNGRIGVHSEPGHGSSFWFTASFEKQLGAGRAPAVSYETLARLRVLVVNPDEAGRRSLQAMLADVGIAAQGVQDGLQGLGELGAAATRGQPYDLVVCDMMGGGVGGLQFARAVRADPRISQIGMIMLAAIGYRGDSEEVRQAGVECYLTEPIERRQLYDAVAAVVQMKAPHGRRGFVTRHNLAEFSRREGGHALVVSDDPVRQKQLLGRVERLGFRAGFAVDAAQALAAASDARYELILVDNEGSELLGSEDIRRIREARGDGQRPGGSLPVLVVVSPESSGELREAYRAAGADGCLAGLDEVDELKRRLPA